MRGLWKEVISYALKIVLVALLRKECCGLQVDITEALTRLFPDEILDVPVDVIDQVRTEQAGQTRGDLGQDWAPFRKDLEGREVEHTPQRRTVNGLLEQGRLESSKDFEPRHAQSSEAGAWYRNGRLAYQSLILELVDSKIMSDLGTDGRKTF